MDCRTCLKVGRVRNGGDIALCWTCAKRRCRGCGKPSAGRDLCVECAVGADISRWRARANLWAFDVERQGEFYEARREKLMQSKFHFHEAVEVFARGLLYAAEALWGKPPADAGGPPAPPVPVVEERKAA